jgi:hypothetical protein
MKMILETEKEPLKSVFKYDSLSSKKLITAKNFRTACKMVKKNQSFHNSESEIEVQQLMGMTWAVFLIQLTLALTF